jgi:hypothetical protein
MRGYSQGQSALHQGVPVAFFAGYCGELFSVLEAGYFKVN